MGVRGQSEHLLLLSDPHGLAETRALGSAQQRLILQALLPVQTRSWSPDLSWTGPEGSIQNNPPKQSLALEASSACTEHQMAGHERAGKDACRGGT